MSQRLAHSLSLEIRSSKHTSPKMTLSAWLCSIRGRKQVRPSPTRGTRWHCKSFPNHKPVAAEVPSLGDQWIQITVHLCFWYATLARHIASKTHSRKPLPPVHDVEAERGETFAGPKSQYGKRWESKTNPGMTAYQGLIPLYPMARAQRVWEVFLKEALG